jgi:hypothetical protein
METALICLGSISFFVVLFGFILLWRYISYRETLALAEKGLVKAERRNGSGKTTLVWGIILSAIGVALMVGMWPIGLGGFGAHYPLGFGPWMIIGLLPLFFGLALILIHVLTSDKKPPQPPLE